MRRIIMFNRVSADGYFSTPDGQLDWATPDEALDASVAAAVSDADAMLFGRRTYDMFERFWPHAIDDSPTAPEPHGGGRRSGAMRTIGLWINEATKYVFSNTRRELTWRGAQLLGGFDAREVAVLKQRPGKTMMVFGSGSIVSLLTRHGLIDEYQLVVSPVLLGGGAPWLTRVSQHTPLALVETRPFPSGNVLFRYQRAG
jgi:dihydrofolate reductase